MTEVQKNKFALNYAEVMAPHIRGICEPLFANFDFSGFAYIKIFPHNKMLHLTTDVNWSKEFFEREFYNEKNCFEAFRRSLLENEKKNFILTGNIRDEYTKWLYEFGIWHTCSIYIRHNGIIEGWAFATHKENKQMLDFYLNHSDILNHFVNYFNEKTKKLILTDDEQKLITLNIKSLNIDEEGANNVKLKEYIAGIDIKYLVVEIENKRILLSKREVEYLNYFLKGYSAKKIAANMNISPRTAESYFSTIKNKTNLKKKEDIILYLKKYFV